MFKLQTVPWLLLITTVLTSLVSSHPTSTSSMVVSSTEASKEALSRIGSTVPPKDDTPILPKIYEMKVDTNVTNRFAKTQITSKVKNLAKTAQEATFSVVLPEKAFISGFIMEIDGKSYEAYVQEKEQAKKTYDTAVQSGQAAAHVAVNARDSNRFTVSVNVEPQSKAVFYLTYEELLERLNEQYEVVLNIQPGQPVKNLNVEVNINETRPLKFVKAPSLRTGNEISKNDEKLDPKANIELYENKTTATIKFSPDIERQKQLASGLGTKEENGLAGQFVVQYDVERDPQGGEVLVDDGYFVHFFAPSDLPTLPKQIVFVLDTSGSMDGVRITQLKEAMNSILTELKSDDIFNIVEFGSIAKVWNVPEVKVQYELGDDPWTQTDGMKNKTGQFLPPAFKATEENINKAKEVVSKLNAYGGTDIQSALKIALELVDLNKRTNNTNQPIIMFLTDGEPTVGEINTDKITSTISELDSKKSPIFSLSFGDGANRDFLQKISLKNLGFARHIYEGADASLQLEEFYKQISSPLLTNVDFKYVSNVKEVTKKHFPILFRGSECVVCGVIDPGFAPPVVQGWGIRGPIDFIPNVQRSVGSLERLWAYLTVKQILEQRDAAENKTGPTQEALKLALKYKFVTDVSSLVVVKPNATNAVDTEDASHNHQNYPTYQSFNKVSFAPLPISADLPPSAYSPAVPLIVGGSAGHGPFPLQAAQEPIPVQFFSTPLILPSTSTTPRPTTPSALEQAKQDLPWLKDLLYSNGTLSLDSGVYDFDPNGHTLNKIECPLAAGTNSTGTCTHLTECKKAYPVLTDVKVYTRYFCQVLRFAGVCCPV